MVREPRIRSGDVVIRFNAVASNCTSVLVLKDEILPDEHWAAYTCAEARAAAEQITPVTKGTIWQLGPEDGAWTKLSTDQK